MSTSDEIASLRRALGRLLAEHRRAAGYSQEAFAPLTGYARSTVANVEIGRQSVPRDFWTRCDHALGSGATFAGRYDKLDGAIRLHREAAARTAQAERDARVREQRGTNGDEVGDQQPSLERRTLLAHGLTVLGLPALDIDDLRHLVAAVDDAYRYLDGSVVEHFNGQLDLCSSDDGERGPRRALPTVLGMLGAIERSVREVKPSIRRELLATASRCAEFTGWLYRDSGATALAEYWRDRAMEWAHAAGDGPMQGYVLLKKSQAAWDQRDAVRMLTLADAAMDGPWTLPSHVRAEAAQQQARGHAMLGDSFDLVRRHLDTAHEFLASNESTNSTVGPHYRAALLEVQTAICYQEAGQSHRSAMIYREHLNRRNFSFRDYGYFASLGAAALASAKQPDQAARLGIRAQHIAEATESTRTANEVRRVAQKLQPWAARPAVRELREAVLTY